MSRYGQCSDEELIERLRNGESKISDYLMEKYKGTVKKRARAMYLIGGETDDLIQEGMIGLFKAVQDYRPDREASFRTFAGLCIDRQLYSAVKNSTRQKHIPLNSYVSLSEEEEKRKSGRPVVRKSGGSGDRQELRILEKRSAGFKPHGK